MQTTNALEQKGWRERRRTFSLNRERLKAERLAREAAGTPVAATKAKPKKKVRGDPPGRKKSIPIGALSPAGVLR